jgi:hypothetical protein
VLVLASTVTVFGASVPVLDECGGAVTVDIPNALPDEPDVDPELALCASQKIQSLHIH